MRRSAFAILAALPLVAACASAPATPSEVEVKDWEMDSRISDFNRRITVSVDGEEAISHRFVPMVGGGTSERAEFRGRDLLLNCRPNPLVYGINCVLRVDGAITAQFQHVF